MVLILKEFVNIRNNNKLQKDLYQVREILGINHDIHGADPEAIRQALKFVIESHSIIWEQFLQRNGPLAREYIKKRLSHG